MKRVNCHSGFSWVIFCILTLFPALPAGAQGDEVAFGEQAVLQETAEALAVLINAARRDPLGTAVSLGQDADELLSQLPDLADILQSGLAPLAVEGRLGQSAEGHAEDILSSGIYSSVSADGRTLEDRMAAASYEPGVAGESLGFLGFVNYVPSQTAVEKIFASLFLEELDPLRVKQRCILNPAFSDLGVAMASGRWKAGEVNYNAYVVVCDFGSTSARQRILDHINAARRDPLATATELGYDADKVLQDFPEFEEVLRSGMPALQIHSQLNRTAELHTVEMLAMQYVSTMSPKVGSQCIPGVSPTLSISSSNAVLVFCIFESVWNRIRAAGYHPQFAGESLGVVDLAEVADEAAALDKAFANMFAAEIDPKNTEKRNLLDPKYEDIGIGVGKGVLTAVGGDAMIVTCDFGVSVD